jgi:hypothetical protein
MRYTRRLNKESADETIANCLMSDVEIGIIYTVYYDKSKYLPAACHVVKNNEFFSISFVYWDDGGLLSEKSSSKSFNYSIDLLEKLKEIDAAGRLDRSIAETLKKYSCIDHCFLDEFITIVEMAIYTQKLTHINSFAYAL